MATPAFGEHMPQNVRPYSNIIQRAAAMALHLPDGPFSAARFLDHAMGLNSIDNAADVDAILRYLTEEGVLLELVAHRMWIAS